MNFTDSSHSLRQSVFSGERSILIRMIFTAAFHSASLVTLSGCFCVLWCCGFHLLLWLYCAAASLCCFVYVSYQAGSFLDNYLSRFRVKSDNKAVFITGCDKGFGRLLARHLDSLGFRVFAGCLEPDGEETRMLIDTTSNRLELVRLDVTKDESVQKALEFVESRLENYELWSVVNNAGVIERGELEWTPLPVYLKQFEVNTFGVVRVTQAFLPLLRKFRGRVVTISSIGGRHTFSGFVPYCMSKHAVTSFCDGLRLEMQKFGVKVVTVEPFSYQTSMTEMSTVLRSIQTTWRHYSDCRRPSDSDVYDDAYVAAFSASVRRFNEATALADTSRVLDALVEAVCADSPHYSYVPGDWASLLDLWLSRRTPKTVVDYFVRNRVTFDCDVEAYLEEKAARKKRA